MTVADKLPPTDAYGRTKMRCCCSCHWRWDWLTFGDSRISPSDADMLFVVERKMRFLFMECKRPGERISGGQLILLKCLSWVPRFTVVVVSGHKEGDEDMLDSFQLMSRGVLLPSHPTSREDFQLRISEWFRKANQNE